MIKKKPESKTELTEAKPVMYQALVAIARDNKPIKKGAKITLTHLSKSDIDKLLSKGIVKVFEGGK